MKKLTLVSMIAFAVCAFAGEGRITTIKSDTSADAVYNLGGYFGWLQNSLGLYTDAYVSFTLESVKGTEGWSAEAIQFSMYSIDQATDSSINTFLAGVDSSGSSATSGTFSVLLSAGDTVGFSISNGDKTVYNTPGVDGVGGTYVATRAEDGKIYIGYFVNTYTQGDVSKADVVYSISVTPSGAVNGQPLPGVVLSMLAGAGVFGLRRRKRV